MKNKTLKNTDRYNLIDALRGFSLINMVIYHLLFDIFQIFELNTLWYSHPLVAAWERFICVSFIIISGISFNFSTHAYRRGIELNIFGFIITAVTVTAFPQAAVWFGILNFLGCAMLIFQPLRAYIERIRPALGMTASMLLFAFTYGVPKRFLGVFALRLITLPDALYGCKYLAFVGFPSADFFSADYFPLVPWLCLFAFGYFLWRFVKDRAWDGFFKLKIPVLGAIGRYSLWIYLAHQPIIMAALYLIEWFTEA